MLQIWVILWETKRIMVKSIQQWSKIFWVFITNIKKAQQRLDPSFFRIQCLLFDPFCLVHPCLVHNAPRGFLFWICGLQTWAKISLRKSLWWMLLLSHKTHSTFTEWHTEWQISWSSLAKSMDCPFNSLCAAPHRTSWNRGRPCRPVVTSCSLSLKGAAMKRWSKTHTVSEGFSRTKQWQIARREKGNWSQRTSLRSSPRNSASHSDLVSCVAFSEVILFTTMTLESF